MLVTLNEVDFHHIWSVDKNGHNETTTPLKEISDDELDKHIKDILIVADRGISITVHAFARNYRQRVFTKKQALELLGYKHYIAERKRRRDERIDKNMKAIMKAMNL